MIQWLVMEELLWQSIHLTACAQGKTLIVPFAVDRRQEWFCPLRSASAEAVRPDSCAALTRCYSQCKNAPKAGGGGFCSYHLKRSPGFAVVVNGKLTQIPRTKVATFIRFDLLSERSTIRYIFDTTYNWKTKMVIISKIFHYINIPNGPLQPGIPVFLKLFGWDDMVRTTFAIFKNRGNPTERLARRLREQSARARAVLRGVLAGCVEELYVPDDICYLICDFVYVLDLS